MIKKSAHQGDVYLKSVDLPNDLSELESSDGKIILAYGEVTHHHHRFEQDNVKMYSANDNSGRRFIVISEKPATLFHEEHAPIEIGPGAYEIFIARQWTDEEEPVAVID